MSKIKVMDDILANKIAAGEVIEKMMNIVKELVENSIDAKSTSIKIELKDAGTRMAKITDNGIGMDEKTLSHVFHKFYQADPSHQQEGNGLGMAMVKQIVDLHHGTIRLESSPGHGTTVILSLPCYR